MTDSQNDAPAAGGPLRGRTMAYLALWGAALWFIAAVLLRMLGPMGVYEGFARVLLYALIIPGTLPFILLIVKLTRVARDQIALACAVMTASAALLDGIALAWFPALYGDDVAHVAGAGATILWGAGVALALGFFLNKAGQEPPA